MSLVWYNYSWFHKNGTFVTFNEKNYVLIEIFFFTPKSALSVEKRVFVAIFRSFLNVFACSVAIKN